MKKIKNIFERFTIDSDFKNIILLSSNDNKLFLLYDITNKSPIGYISFGYYEKLDVYTVGGAYSKDGFGAFLYETAMSSVYPKGLSMSRDSTTSGDAIAVWIKFHKRKDVKKERMYSTEITHKKEDWIEGGFLDDNPEYRNFIFELEDTKFFFSYGRDNLRKVIEEGKSYMLKNNITDDMVKYMSWNLE
jgi:hypothetical protein